MKMDRILRLAQVVLFPAILCSANVALVAAADQEKAGEFTALFPKDGVPQGWIVRHWADVKNPPPEGAVWTVKEGVLHGSDPRGTWLVSEKEYSDFVLEFEWILGERGNSGCGLRFPMEGDPAFDGLELQMVDPRYYGSDIDQIGPAELTGALYKAVAPRQQLYKPVSWNKYQITCQGPKVRVLLNDQEIINVNLDEQTKTLERGTPLKDRPRKGHLGFQELSRGGGHVMIRNARIKELGR